MYPEGTYNKGSLPPRRIPNVDPVFDVVPLPPVPKVIGYVVIPLYPSTVAFGPIPQAPVLASYAPARILVSPKVNDDKLKLPEPCQTTSGPTWETITLKSPDTDDVGVGVGVFVGVFVGVIVGVTVNVGVGVGVGDGVAEGIGVVF